jgi:hypothetical protein
MEIPTVHTRREFLTAMFGATAALALAPRGGLWPPPAPAQIAELVDFSELDPSYARGIAAENATRIFREVCELAAAVITPAEAAELVAAPSWPARRRHLVADVAQAPLAFPDPAGLGWMLVWALEVHAGDAVDRSRISWVRLDGSWRMALVTDCAGADQEPVA